MTKGEASNATTVTTVNGEYEDVVFERQMIPDDPELRSRAQTGDDRGSQPEAAP